MNTPVLNANGIYIQQTFSAQSEECIRRKYGLANAETLLAALWCGAFIRYGFVFTDKSMYWRCGSEDSEFFSLQKNAAEEKLTVLVDGCTGSVAHIQLEYGSEKSDLFISGIDSEKAHAFVKLVSALFNGEDFLLEDFAPHVKQFPLVKVRACADAVQNALSALNEKIDSAQKKLNERKNSAKLEREKLKAQKSAASDDAAKQKTTPTPKTKTAVKKSAGEKVSYGILCVLDVLASLVFVAMVVLALKPWLLNSVAGGISGVNELNNIHFIYRIGDYVLSVDPLSVLVLDETLIQLERLIAGLALIVFTALKIIVLCFSKNGVRKIISVLLLAMTLLSCFLLHEKFILFFLFCLLLYICFEFSCGLRAKRVFIRLLVVFVLSVVLYFSLHFALDPELGEFFKAAHVKLSFPPVKWW